MRYLLSLLLVVIVLWSATGLTMIKPGERGVIRRFGKVLEEKPKPGLHVGLPWGIDRVDRVQVEKVRSVQIGYSPALDDETGLTMPPGQLLTGDHNLVNIQAIVSYAVNEDEVEKFVIQEDRAETLVGRAAQTVLAEWVASHGVDMVILKGKASKLDGGRQSLPDALVMETQRRLAPYELGVVIQDARVTLLSAPNEVKDAFDDVFRAKAQIQTKMNQANQYKARRLNEVSAEAYEIKQKADSYYNEQVKLAEADARNFETRLVLYHKMKKTNPYYRNVVWWDEVSQIYQTIKANGQIDLLDHRLGSGGLDITQFPSMSGKK